MFISEYINNLCSVATKKCKSKADIAGEWEGEDQNVSPNSMINFAERS